MNNLSITKLIRQPGDFVKTNVFLPLARFAKLPLTLKIVVTRIHEIGKKFNIDTNNIQIFRINKRGIIEAKRALKNQGGIYIWFCHVTGFFYVGSTMCFFGQSGRLSNYLSLSRLTGKTKTVSQNLSKDMLKYGYSAFSLIIVETSSIDAIVIESLRRSEQLWILLYPTYNKTLKVGSPFTAIPMPESTRKKMSTKIYQYEVDKDGIIIKGSEYIHYGIKELIRNGFTSMYNDLLIPISYFTLGPLIKSKGLYKGKFIFSKIQLEEETQYIWVTPVSHLSSTERLAKKGGKVVGIWVYIYHDPIIRYTKNDFVEFVPSVKECEKKYNISKTNFQKVRKLFLNHKGYLFSNIKLH